MSQTNLKTVNTKLTVTSDGMDKGLKEGEQKAKGYAQKVAGIFDSVFKGLQSGNPLGMLGGSGGLLGLALGGAGVGAGATVGSQVMEKIKSVGDNIFHFVHNQHQKLLELDKSATRAGMTRKERGGLDVLLGAEGGDNAAHLIQRMNKLIGEAQLGSEEARKKLGHFGLTMDDVMGKSRTQQIEMFAKAIAKVGPSLRGALARELGGRGGQEELPALLKIAKGGLGEAQDFAQRVGATGTDEDVAHAREMDAHEKRRAVSWEGTKRRAASSLGWVATAWDYTSQGITEGAGIVAQVPKALTYGSFRLGYDVGNKLYGPRDAKRSDWDEQMKQFEARRKQEEQGKAEEATLAQGRKEDLFNAADKKIGDVKRLGDTVGMAADAVALFDMKQALAKEHLEDTAEGMKRLADFTKELATTTDKVNIDKFSKMADPFKANRDQFGDAMSLYNRGELGRKGFGAAGMGWLAQSEAMLGLSSNRMANIVTDSESGSMASAQADQLARQGGGEKSVSDRIEAVFQAQQPFLDKQEKHWTEFETFYKQGGFSRAPVANTDN